VKILLGSHFFSPFLGGIETVSLLLAGEFVRAGHEVRVITQTREDDGCAHPFQVVRGPSRGEVWRQVRWCDVFFQNNISLQTAWAALLLRKPWVVMHQTWLTGTDGRAIWQTWAKRLMLRRARGIAISPAVAEHVGGRCTVVGNPYDAETFRVLPDAVRDRDLVFLGRLVSDKGADILLHALGHLRKKGITPSLTIIGGGSEEATLRSLVAGLGLDAQVEFVGPLKDRALAAMLNRHQAMAVPSRWAEPFGVVALEGAGCGCVLIGSEQGGLAYAIGPCGITVPNGDAVALADAIARVLGNEELREGFRAAAPAHLARFTSTAVAAQCMQVIQEAARRS